MEIILNDFLKKFKSNNIGPINLNVREKRITAILGSSGSGKSVVLNSIVGATKKFKGDILIKNKSRKGIGNYKINRSISFYAQVDFALYNIKVTYFLKAMCLMYGINKKEINKKIEYWLNFFDLWIARDKKVSEFSWGMKNRLNLILCFLKESDIIIMDEPGANLDSYWRNKIKNLLIDYKLQGKTIIITVHNIDEVSDIIDDYIIIDGGKKIFEGMSSELNLYSKYKIYIKDEFDIDVFRKFLVEKNIETFKYDKIENSLVIAFHNQKQINYLFLYLIKNNLPLLNLIKLPINMEAIHDVLRGRKNKIKIDIKK